MTQRYSDIENAAPPDDGGGYQYPETGGDPPLSIELPEATPSQKIAMDEFIKSPSQDRWQELVETMIRQRQEQEQSIEFFSQRSSCGNGSPRRTSPRRRSRSPRKSSSRSPRKSISSSRSPRKGPPRQFYTEVKPDPPSHEPEEDNDMGGWTMHAAKNSKDEDEEVSDQLKSMLSHSCTPSNGGEVSVNYPSSSCSPCLFTNKSKRPPLNTMCIFLLGFVIGTIIIVGVSFTFDRTPSEELRVIALRAHGSRQHIGDSRDTNVAESNDMEAQKGQAEDDEEEVPDGFLTSHTSQDEEEGDLIDFCDSCQWKQAEFNCKKRVDWEVSVYGLTEEAAKRANLKHCTTPTSVEEGGP